MKTLMVISEAPPITSGVSRVAEKLTQGLERRGHHVDVLSLQDVPRWEWGEVRISSMPLKLRQIKDRLLDYDLIHLHGPVPTFSDVFLLWGLRGLGAERPQLVYTHHAPVDLRTLPFRPFVALYNGFQERLARLADHVVASTPTYARRLARFVPDEKLSVIPWGVDYAKFVGPVHRESPFTVVYLGQLRPYKGLSVLLDAAAGLEDTRVWVIGDGHLADQSRQRATDLGLTEAKFWGRLPDCQVRRVLQQSHVIVLPSVTRSEAFGIVLLEGMAAGLVPVASDLPGVADVVGSEGFTFPAGDVRALKQVLVHLRDNPVQRSRRATLAQAKAKAFSWERVVLGYDWIFTQLISQSQVTKPLPDPTGFANRAYSTQSSSWQ
jgi:glycosyltransferase involved in cell wall biosynthesis